MSLSLRNIKIYNCFKFFISVTITACREKKVLVLRTFDKNTIRECRYEKNDEYRLFYVGSGKNIVSLSQIISLGKF